MDTYLPYTIGNDVELDRILKKFQKAQTQTVIHHETCPCCGAKLVNLYRKTTKDKEWKCKKCWDKTEEVE